MNIKRAFPKNVMEEEFPPWFDDQIRQKSVKKDPTFTPELFFLACGPNAIARSFTACLVNGVRFLVHERDIHRTTQNSRVSTPREHKEMYYGRLKEILELTSIGNRKKSTIHSRNTSKTSLLPRRPARRPLHWKVVEEVHHRKNFLWDIIVVEDEQDVIHGDTSSDVALPNEFPNLDDTILSTNGESTEVDVSLDTEVRDDDFIYDIDDVAHDIGSDDEVDPTDDEFAEVGRRLMLYQMVLSVAPSYHGGDAGGDPPERLNRLLPHQCEGSGQRGPTTLQALKTAYRKNDNIMLKDQIPETARVSILPELKGWFDLEPHLNDQTKIRVGKTDKTVGRMVKLGLLQKSIKEANEHMPSKDDWKKGQATWEKQVDWWADPKRVEKLAKNAENRAKKRTSTYQGSKSFALGRHEYARMKSIKDQVNARTIKFKSDKEIIAEVAKSTNREHEPGVDRKLPIIRQEVVDKERWKKAAEEALQQADLAKK
ncbi:hypothetical protein Tco_1270812 [Tanacetum coccineum]